MSYLEESANCVIGLYLDARARAVCQDGITAIYFLNGGYHGTRWLVDPLHGLTRSLTLGDETYRLKLFREKNSPMYKYPFYVLRP